VKNTFLSLLFEKVTRNRGKNVIPCEVCYDKGVSCLHASVIDDEYYTACKYEKDWIMEKYPLLV
jgi:hypothetical protein